MSARAIVRLTTRCDNACRFCGQHGTPASDADDWRARLDAARRAGADEVSFVGGEPLLCRVLVPAVAHAATLGFGAIGVQTNGRALGERATVTALVDGGLTDVHLSIHGARAAVHDYHTGVEGSFERVKTALGHLRAAGSTVVVTTVLTRSNARVLAELPALLDHGGVAAWSIAVPHTAGRAALEFDRVVPRLGLAIPFALHALDRARKLGMAVAITGAPACLLGPWTDASVIDVPRAWAEVCDGCGAQAACAGIDAHYLSRFGGDELRPRAAPGPTGTAMPDRLRRMFVGPGELVPVVLHAHDHAASARRRLPMLERPSPGREETRRAPQPAAALFPELDDES